MALTHLKEVPEPVSKEAIATALCGASGSVGGDWRDKKMVRVEGSKDRIVDAIYALQLTAQQTTIPIPTVEEIADHIDLWFRTGEDKPWSFIVEDLAGSIHSLLTDRLKGGK